MVRTIHAAAADIRAGGLSPVDLLESCLERIDRFEERIRAWVLVDREGARAEAKRLTDELKRGQYRGPLHGIPIGIKDIFDVFDWPTAAGSRLWANSIARQDATVVRRLREAGAVLVGKTVTTQYASFDPPPTRNPWNLERTPGGSSSGSAAAVAVGMCLGALGSQTGGSITRPASYCGVAGCKPTYGRVSCHGAVPLAHSMDHPGPMARCVRDLAIILQAISGPDASYIGDAEPADIPDVTAKLARPLSAPRIGVVRGLFEDKADSCVRGMMDQALRTLRQRHAMIFDVALPASFSEVLERHRIVMAVEAAEFHESRLRKHPEDYGPNITKLLEEGISCPAPMYARTKAHQRRLQDEVASCFGDVEVLICPATTTPAPEKGTTGDPAFNSPWSYTGLPSVSFPVGVSESGLPLAIQLVGTRFGEERLFEAAAWCEEVFAGCMPEPPL
jgi:aspartyl-tRNA(Asn)/glutamyl-tRNA(Gln) amidotransferase subunit A